MCKDPTHHAYKSGPKVGKFTHWFAVILVGAAMRFCSQCWAARLSVVALKVRREQS